MITTHCRYCAVDFGQPQRHSKSGAKKLYCSVKCKQRNTLDKQAEKRRARYAELKALGCTSYQANYGSTSLARRAEVLQSLGTDVPLDAASRVQKASGVESPARTS
jgi:hypothetical protein